MKRLLFAAFALLVSGCTDTGELASLKLALRTSSTDMVTAQSEVGTKLNENTQALLSLATKIDELKAAAVVQPIEVGESATEAEPVVVKEEPQTVAEAAAEPEPVLVDLYLTNSPNYCPPCNAADRDIEAGKFSGFNIIRSGVYDGVAKYPAFRFRDANSETGWSVVYGYGDDQLAWLREHLLGLTTAKESPKTQSMSQSDMIALHNSMHGGGDHPWPGDLKTHLENTHGVNFDGNTQYSRDGNVTSQRTNFRSVSRWVGNGWRSGNTTRRTFFACPNCR